MISQDSQLVARDREKLTVTKETRELTKETQDHRRLAPAKGGARRFVFFGQMLGNGQLLSVETINSIKCNVLFSTCVFGKKN